MIAWLEIFRFPIFRFDKHPAPRMPQFCCFWCEGDTFTKGMIFCLKLYFLFFYFLDPMASLLGPKIVKLEIVKTKKKS